MNAEIEIKKDKDWSEYPIGTKAKAIGGGYWERSDNGWKWCNGSTFPRPGADASGFVVLPLSNSINDKLNKAPVMPSVCDDYDPEIAFPNGNGKCKTCGKYHD